MNHDGILMEDTSHHSQRSMSLSSSASDIANDTVGSSSLDHLFPLFDEITRTAPQKMGSSVIMIFIIFLEAFTNGYFPFLPDFWNLNEQPDKILRYFAYLLDFGNSDESVLKTYVPSIVILALSYMIFFWFLGIVQYYRINKTFSRASIIATRILFSFILPFLLIPNMNSIGFNFNAIFYAQSGSHSAYIALTVLSVISGAINYFLFYFDIIFRSSTPYLENSCFSMWDGKPFFTFVLVQGLAAFSSRLLFHFPAWTKYFLVALYGVVNLVMALNCFVFHFIPEICNISLAAMHMTNLLSAVFAVCPISSTVRLIIPIPIFIVMQSVFYFLFKMTRKKAIELLPTKLEEQALMTMRIVMADDPKSFVDWTLIRQITALHPTTNVFIRIAQVLSFFPSESQLLNHYVMIISKHSDLKLHERFMFYQIRRVHVLRQSSANKQFNFEFEEVKKQTSKMIACFSQFFVTNNELSIGTLIGLVKLNKKTNSLCNEALEKYPNSSRLAYEYSRYLIECHAEFKEGTAWYNKAEQMDTGKHTAIDYSFRSMVNLYPVYLKKNILDYKGKKIITVEKTKAGSSASSLTGNNGNVDEEANEELAERIFDKPRLRFALKRATDNMKCVPLELIYEGSVVRYILTFIVFISLYFGFRGFFNGRLDNTVLMESVATVREVIAVGLVSLCHLVGTAFGAIDQIYIKEETAEYDIFNNTAQSMILGIINGIKATQTLGSMIASHGSSIIETAREYMIDGKINYCFDNGTIMDATFVSTRSLSYYLLTHLLNAQSAISPTMSKTSVICELIGNVPTFQEQMDKQTVLFTTREASTADEINHKLDIAFILVPIALAICLLSPLVIGLLLLHKDLKRLFSAVMLLPRDVFVQGSKPIVKTDFDSSTVASSIEMDRTPVFGIPIVVICSMIISVVSVTMVLLMIRDTNNNFMNAALWLETSARRGPFLIELVSDAYFLAFFQISQSTTYGNVSEKAHRVKQNLDVVMKLNRDLLLGNDEMPACNGFSKELDEIHFSSSCSEEYEEYGLHGNYNCLSVDQLMMVYSKFTEDLLSTFTSNPMYPVGKTDPFNQLAHLVFYHIFPNLQRVQVILSDACQNLIKDTNVTNGVILIISFLIITILFIIELLMNHKMDAAYNTLKIIIARFPPNAVISNQNLLDAIIGRAQMKRVKQVSAAQSVIDSSPDAIFALSGDYSIESMNPAASHIFGYTPEQILGQSITTLIPNPDADKDPLVLTNNNTESSLYRQLALMKANQASMTYTCQAIGLKDDETEVNLVVTLIGINEGQYFALIANDQTIMLRQQKEVEDAKKQAEKLLYQILPRDIVTRMNRGEKDISFTVPSSTISFIDVVKFSDYMATLTPKQVMQNLGKYFKNWDDLLQKYKTIIKIKLIGDVYMAAAGLFNPELPPNTHAVEMLSFAIDGVRALDEINHSLEANLSVRIGINTGGPIIAGVLGTDKPLFDIIGDPINLASRLQSTDIANNVQISQSTYDLVKDKNFDIEKRGEIMLKGKGAQMAYLVHPAAQILPMANTQQTGSSFRLPRLGSSYRTINQLPSMKNMQTFPSTLLENHIPEDDDDHNDETSPKAND